MERRETRSDWEEARAFSFDMAQLERNLELSPAERVRRHSRALALALALRAAAEKRSG